MSAPSDRSKGDMGAHLRLVDVGPGAAKERVRLSPSGRKAALLVVRVLFD